MSHHTDQWPSPDGATGPEPHRAAERNEPGDVPAFRVSEYAEGTAYAPCDQVALIHEGEHIVPVDEIERWLSGVRA